MNELKNQINNTRAYLAQNKMFSELEGFDAAIRLFADANKKSFKEKASEVWKKHKGKILAGAAIAAAGGIGGKYAYDKYQEKEKKEKEKKANEEELVRKAEAQTKAERIDTIKSLIAGPMSNLNYIPLLGNLSTSSALSFYKFKYPDEYDIAHEQVKGTGKIPGMPGGKFNYK